jgi:hypothetical protein
MFDKVRLIFSFFFLMACPSLGAASASSWMLSVNQQNGLPIVSRGGAIAISSNFAFWEKHWAWAGLSTKFDQVSPLKYTVRGSNPALALELSGEVKQSSNRQMTWVYDFNALSNIPDVIGGGMSLQFDLETFRAKLGDPEIIAGNLGWSWGQAGKTRFEMRFDPPMAAMYFEGGRKSEIRAFFYQGLIPKGQRHYTVTLSLSNDVAITPIMSEQFGLDDPTKWPLDLVDWQQSPVDLSFLNGPERPAGKRGFVRSAKGRLEFEDGTPARFWGTNLTAAALFGTDLYNVKRQARRLSELGFNLVRLHHHDSAWVNPNIFGNSAVPNTKNLDATMLQRLDWWIQSLKDEGIYVWLDLEVGRRLRPADGITDFAEIARGSPEADLRGYSYVNMSIQNAMREFNQVYVNHHNVFTGLRYADDPAIVAMLLTNENDLTHHFGNALLPDKNVPQHNALYMADAKAFATKFGLSSSKIWRSWEPGPSKLFLNDLEHRFDLNMIRQLRELGIKVPIVTTSYWGNAPLSSLPALTSGDIVDAHSYGGIDELKKNPIYIPNMTHWIAAAHVAGRPLSATEWNVEPFPSPDRHTIPLYIAGTAKLQGWDALMQYAYSQTPLGVPAGASNWESFNDPGLLATLPAAALLYRRNDVREAQTVYVFAPTTDQLFDQLISPSNSVALRSAVEKSKVVIAMPQTIELPWLERSMIPVEAKIIADPNRSVIETDAGEAVSDTGELRHNWEQGIYTINTPRTQAAIGWIGGKRINLSEVEIMATTRNASISVQSLDDRRIDQSRAILISFGARSVPTATNQTPFHSEPVEGQLSIRAPEGLKLYTKRPSSSHAKSPATTPSPTESTEVSIPATYKDGCYQITFEKNIRGHWLFLQ